MTIINNELKDEVPYLELSRRARNLQELEDPVNQTNSTNTTNSEAIDVNKELVNPYPDIITDDYDYDWAAMRLVDSDTLAANADPEVEPSITLYRESEVYPINDPRRPELGCQNDAKTVDITQELYYCYKNSNPAGEDRVNFETYTNIRGLPYYQKRMTCYSKQETNQACWCSAGFEGALCDENSLNKCYVNIT